MAAAHADNLKIQTNTTKQKRRRYRETTITATAFEDSDDATEGFQNCQPGRRLDTPPVVSADKTWCCSTSKLPPPAPAVPDLKIRHSPSAMESSSNEGDHFTSPFSKFNTALTAGLLNPMSPPLLMDKARSSPTLFEMMASEPDCHTRVAAHAQNGAFSPQNCQNSKFSVNPCPQDKKALMQQRLMDFLASRSPGNQFNDAITGDVKLTLSSKDGINISITVHRQILVAHSRFFALKLNEKWVLQQRSAGPYLVEIADCDDIEVYIETLRLMYCKDLRRKLMKEDISRVLGILKVSAAIGFDAGVHSCLEYLEAAPWDKDEEEKVTSLLSELRLEGVGAAEVLKRVSFDVSGPDYGHDHEEILIKLLQVVLEGKDEKARREMKALVTKMLRENPSHHEDLRKESLYSACDGCLKSLHSHFLQAAAGEMQDVAQIARQSDNLHWLLDILIHRQIAEEFLKTWASMSELSEVHSKVPPVHRYEVSRVTARLFVGIGKDQLLASKASRCLLLQTWLVPFYEDFGWMRRASKGLDRHLIEEGLSNTILTLPMTLQQDILLAWFDRFLNTGDDCPNIQRGFEVWWRRSFWRRKGGGEIERRPHQMRIMAANIDNS